MTQLETAAVEGTDTDRDDSTGPSRRTLLGVLAGLAMLPAASSQASSAKPVDVSSDDVTGSTRTEIESGRPVFGALEVSELVDEETEIAVRSFAHDDEVGEVEVTVALDGAHVIVSCSPDRARDLADELRTAADHAGATRW